jgi:hypothetical protein
MDSHQKAHGARKAVEAAATKMRRRPGLQALAVLVVLVADGLLIAVVGGPRWLTLVYAGSGVILALARLAWVQRGRRALKPVVPGKLPAAQRPAGRRLAVGYVRLYENGDRAALNGHRDAITAYADAHGLKLTTVVHDVARPPGESDGRPALRWALERISGGDVQVLIVARLAHLSDSVADLSPLLRWFAADGRALVAIDLRLDMSTEMGRRAAQALDRGWQEQRPAPPPPRTIPSRPPERRRGQGRAAVADRPELQQRIVEMREQGMTLQAIADMLNEEGVPTVRGGAMWRPSSVQRAAGYQRPRASDRGIESPRGAPNGNGHHAPNGNTR